MILLFFKKLKSRCSDKENIDDGFFLIIPTPQSQSTQHKSRPGLFILSLAKANAGSLTVYTAIEAEDLKRYAATFNEDHPDIEINWVRDSTGIVTAKLLAEKNNPQADIIWGLAGTSLMLMKSEGMFEPYSPKGIEKLEQLRALQNGYKIAVEIVDETTIGIDVPADLEKIKFE